MVDPSWYCLTISLWLTMVNHNYAITIVKHFQFGTVTMVGFVLSTILDHSQTIVWVDYICLHITYEQNARQSIIYSFIKAIISLYTIFLLNHCPYAIIYLDVKYLSNPYTTNCMTIDNPKSTSSIFHFFLH